MDLVFFGTGPVAAASLEALSANFAIELVITKQAPEHNRNNAPVIEMTNKLRLPAAFANTREELDILMRTKRFKSQLGVIVDFGVIVSSEVINSFSLGIINSHFSLLPAWRGADPISFAILTGDKKTGVSLMLIEPTLDTGKLLAQKSLRIEPEDTTPSLTNKLITLSNHLLREYLPLYFKGTLKPHAQPHPDRATYSRKLTKADGTLDWQKPADQLEREVRAFTGWPKTSTKLAGKDVIVTQAYTAPSQSVNSKPGDIEPTNETGTIIVRTGNGSLCIQRLKPAGKKEMTAAEFLRGYGQSL